MQQLSTVSTRGSPTYLLFIFPFHLNGNRSKGERSNFCLLKQINKNNISTLQKQLTPTKLSKVLKETRWIGYQFKQLSDKISPSMCSADANNVITSFYDYHRLILSSRHIRHCTDCTDTTASARRKCTCNHIMKPGKKMVPKNYEHDSPNCPTHL